jgi:aryl-alcohol dehydrogenase-like predicted oxidoreductase
MKAGGNLVQKEKELEMAKLALEQEKKNLQFDKIDLAFSHSPPEAYRETEVLEPQILPLLGRLLKKLFR